MSKEKEEVVVSEHLGQFKAMLESCEMDFESYDEQIYRTVIELYNGTRFIFDDSGMLLEIEN